MKITLRQIRLGDLDAKERRVLRKLTLTPQPPLYSGMRALLAASLFAGAPLALAYDDKRIVSWAALAPFWSMMVFVTEKHRHRGIARMLIAALQKQHPDAVFVSPAREFALAQTS